MDKIIKVHEYLDSLPEIGKVLSFGSILKVAEDLNNKKLQSLVYYDDALENYFYLFDILFL